MNKLMSLAFSAIVIFGCSTTKDTRNWRIENSCASRKAKKQLGEKFDIRAFHDQVLKVGCLPLSILEKQIDRWIISEKLIDKTANLK